jgi:cytochrome c-type biogenesis protein CcmH/NrfG
MWANLGAVYMEQDRLQDALYAYANATTADPTYAPAYTNKGRIVSKATLHNMGLV